MGRGHLTPTVSTPAGPAAPAAAEQPASSDDAGDARRSPTRTVLRAAAVPVASVVLGLVLGAVLIAVQGHSVSSAYSALVLGGAGDADALLRTLQKATPLVFGGLAVAFAFKAGLFNIGGQGQLLVGAAFAAGVGFGLEGVPLVVHLPLALLVGAAAGAAWGAIAGVLKATSGAHEVIVTIMLNFVAGNLTDWLAANPWQDRSGSNIIARTPLVQPSAEIPTWGWLPAGFVLAVIASFACWFILERTTYGFEVRSVGANRHAARYAGISVGWIMASTMAVAGLLAGLGGAIESLGVDGRFEAGGGRGPRLRGHHDCAAGPHQPHRGHPRRPAGGVDGSGRRQDAVRVGGRARDHRRDPGADPAVRGSAADRALDSAPARPARCAGSPPDARRGVGPMTLTHDAGAGSDPRAASGDAGMGGWSPQRVWSVAGAVALVACVWGFYAWDGAQTTAVLGGTVRAATLLVLGAMCGMIGERSGIVNIGIEGQFLMSAFTAFTVASMSGSLFLGVVAGVSTGLAMGWMLAAMSVGLRTDQIIAGTVLNIAALGLTSFFYDRGRSLGQPKYQSIELGPLADLPVVGTALFNRPPLTYLALVLVVVLHVLLLRSVWGMRTTAIGEHPGAAATVGIDVIRLRYWNVTLAGGLAGLGGAYLALESVWHLHPGHVRRAGLPGACRDDLRSPHPAGRLRGGAVLRLHHGIARPVPAQRHVRHPGTVRGDAAVRGHHHRGGRSRPVRPHARPGCAGPALRGPMMPASAAAVAETQPEVLLAGHGITKRFGSVVANDDVSVELRPGRILALLGENGAGKSTLVNVLFGLHRPDAGQVVIADEQVELSSPHDAIARGVGMVHQHFQLVPPMSVVRNIVLGAEPRKLGMIDVAQARRRVMDLADRFGLHVDPDAAVEDLPVGAQQRVEILKALYRDARVLIADEPTAVLTPQETDHLLDVLRGLTAQGVGIVFITHKLREVMAAADDIVVAARGQGGGHHHTCGNQRGGSGGVDGRPRGGSARRPVRVGRHRRRLGGPGRDCARRRGASLRGGER